MLTLSALLAAALKLLLPALLLIALVLLAAFGRTRPAAIILTHVPFAAVGGLLMLRLWNAAPGAGHHGAPAAEKPKLAAG